jgi:hypothetical protein
MLKLERLDKEGVIAGWWNLKRSDVEGVIAG